MNENVQFLKEHPVFCRLSNQYLETLADHMEVINIDPGETVFEEGGDANDFYLVMEGTVDLYANRAGKEEEWIQMIDVGGVLGWSWIVPPYRWVFSARTRDGVMLMRFDASAIRDLCERDPAFGYGTMKQICALLFQRLQVVRTQLMDK